MGTHDDILERLRIDPGQRTLGELLQDREAAVHEITNLRDTIGRLRAEIADPSTQLNTAGATGTLLKINEVSKMVALSRSSIYKRLSEGAFPKPVRLGKRAIRWHVDEIARWRESL